MTNDVRAKAMCNYLWADGLTPRSDGLTWACSDFNPDGTHPAQGGRQKVGTQLLEFFLSSPVTAAWFRADGGAAPCYANCDSSTTEPILNVDDFTCFINAFAQAQALPHEQQLGHYANCDSSTTAPALNVDDFTCFVNAFAQGCR